MPLNIQPEAPPLRVDETGTVRVGATRVILELVVHAFRDGATPEQIVQDYDTLDLADVYSVVGYYLRHRVEVDAYLAERAREGEELRKRIEASQRHLPDIRARLLAARARAEASQPNGLHSGEAPPVGRRVGDTGDNPVAGHPAGG
ncbi:MAG: hypothetical protein C0501_08825 [Isosphaera sp.]|nr:hypothetical protein [Isosphaera sp.]